MNALSIQSTGSSTKIQRAMFADFDLSIEKGEGTEKGSINQRAILSHRKSAVDRLYNKHLQSGVLEAED